MIRSITRALSILEAFDRDHQSMTLGELSRLTGIAKATVFRVTTTLEAAGYLLRTEENRLCLAPKVTTLAAGVRSNLWIREIARPLMLDLCRRTGETITLNELDGLERVCIEVVDTPAPLMTIVKPGEHVGLLFGATGKILLAWMESSAIDAAIAKLPTSERARIDRPVLVRQLQRFRSQGFALSRGERIPGGSAIAVALPDREGRVRYCLSLTGPAVRVTPRVREFTAMLQATARDLTSKLGGRTLSMSTKPGAPTQKPSASRTQSKRRAGNVGKRDVLA